MILNNNDSSDNKLLKNYFFKDDWIVIRIFKIIIDIYISF
jgi:hypothetical protein